MAGQNCDILLYGTMADIGPTVRDDLKAHGLEVVLVDFAQNTPRDFWGYGRGLSKAIARYAPRVVMPIGDSLAMARLAKELRSAPGAPDFIVAAPEVVELLNSKVRTYSLAEELGILQPRRFTFEEIRAREEAYAQRFPQASAAAKAGSVADRAEADGTAADKCRTAEARDVHEAGTEAKVAAAEREDIGVIFKRDTSFGGSGVHRPRSLDSLRHLIEHENGTPYLIEEYIPGEDLSVDCVRAEGYFRGEAYLSLGRVYTQGPAAVRRGTECPEAVRAAKCILDRLDYRGVCGFDFRLTPAGALYLLEANPRFTGGLRTQIARGFDIPGEMLGHLASKNARNQITDN